jgi:magnesium chelatase subunit I
MGREITKQEVRIHEGQESVIVPKVMEMLIEQIAIEARDNDFVDSKSGVSARLPISAYENVVSAVERRCIRNGDTSGVARISDLSAAIPAIIGKIEMVYEGEQEGAANVAHRLIGQAIRSIAPYYFSGIDELNQRKTSSESLMEYESVTNWFQKSQKLDLLTDMSQNDYESELDKVSGLREKIEALDLDNENISTTMEFLLTSLAEYSILEKKRLERSVSFQDYFSSVVGGIN